MSSRPLLSTGRQGMMSPGWQLETGLPGAIATIEGIAPFVGFAPLTWYDDHWLTPEIINGNPYWALPSTRYLTRRERRTWIFSGLGSVGVPDGAYWIQSTLTADARFTDDYSLQLTEDSCIGYRDRITLTEAGVRTHEVNPLFNETSGGICFGLNWGDRGNNVLDNGSTYYRERYVDTNLDFTYEIFLEDANTRENVEALAAGLAANLFNQHLLVSFGGQCVNSETIWFGLDPDPNSPAKRQARELQCYFHRGCPSGILRQEASPVTNPLQAISGKQWAAGTVVTGDANDFFNALSTFELQRGALARQGQLRRPTSFYDATFAWDDKFAQAGTIVCGPIQPGSDIVIPFPIPTGQLVHSIRTTCP